MNFCAAYQRGKRRPGVTGCPLPAKKCRYPHRCNRCGEGGHGEADCRLPVAHPPRAVPPRIAPEAERQRVQRELELQQAEEAARVHKQKKVAGEVQGIPNLFMNRVRHCSCCFVFPGIFEATLFVQNTGSTSVYVTLWAKGIFLCTWFVQASHNSFSMGLGVSFLPIEAEQQRVRELELQQADEVAAKFKQQKKIAEEVQGIQNLFMNRVRHCSCCFVFRGIFEAKLFVQNTGSTSVYVILWAKGIFL
jgi:hypothetical protein